LAVHVLRICQGNIDSNLSDQIKLPTLVGLLHLLGSKKSYNNVLLRHNVFCILQIAAGRLVIVTSHVLDTFSHVQLLYFEMQPLHIAFLKWDKRNEVSLFNMIV
jgi:hypothetical protein